MSEFDLSIREKYGKERPIKWLNRGRETLGERIAQLDESRAKVPVDKAYYTSTRMFSRNIGTFQI